MSNYRPEATVVLQYEKTYWFKVNFGGEEISPALQFSPETEPPARRP